MGMSGKVALVTGGTRGLGRAITRALACDGVHIAAAYAADDAAAATLVAEIEAEGGSISVHRLDVADRQAARALVGSLEAAHASVDYLVNNAGLLLERKVVDVTEHDWDRSIEVNLSAAFHLTQAVWPGMVEREFGRVVNVGSVTAMVGNPVEAAYGAAKAGLVGLTRSLARAGARKGITVNCVVPGVFETDMTNSMPEPAQERIRAMIPLARRGHPDELAHAVRFLLDDLGAYVTGAVISVDGGLGMGD